MVVHFGEQYVLFHIVSTVNQVQFEINRRIEESWANVLRPIVKGMLANGLQNKANKFQCYS